MYFVEEINEELLSVNTHVPKTIVVTDSLSCTGFFSSKATVSSYRRDRIVSLLTFIPKPHTGASGVPLNTPQTKGRRQDLTLRRPEATSLPSNLSLPREQRGNASGSHGTGE